MNHLLIRFHCSTVTMDVRGQKPVISPMRQQLLETPLSVYTVFTQSPVCLGRGDRCFKCGQAYGIIDIVNTLSHC